VVTESSERSRLVRVLNKTVSVLFAAALTVALFLVLPVIQSIGRPDRDDLVVRDVGMQVVEPPEPEAMEEEIEEEQPPEPPPELTEVVTPLDLSQLELALNTDIGGAGFGEISMDLAGQLDMMQESKNVNEIFSLNDLDRKPRVLFQRAPVYPPELLQARREATVTVLFVVNEDGKVTRPKVQKSTDPRFEGPALDAVKHWKFEPGTRNGKKVQFKMRIPIAFKAG
jgi:protein TonB